MKELLRKTIQSGSNITNELLHSINCIVRSRTYCCDKISPDKKRKDAYLCMGCFPNIETCNKLKKNVVVVDLKYEMLWW